jgi:hypothetical protein
MFKTEICWAWSSRPAASQFNEYIQPFIDQGVTDGNVTYIRQDGEITKGVRQWTTREAAQSWIDLVQPFSFISADIIEE